MSIATDNANDSTSAQMMANQIPSTPNRAGIMSDINLRTMVELMGADHILYAEDYPYEQPTDFHDFLMRSSLTDEQKQLIAYKNAERIYHLK